ncbi:SDR family oxidoreductase [Devosia sp. Leaf64]|uniref:SDR family oxidoreductase n=1 Tax=Devosia sp. Leaf64 TaxID=1736229 RepID=UPI00071272FF|nr:SDR family oxidoreductase [Devosia sp. Leaf64]KQN72686.1 NAD-dependent dehydratase [Devosia sp. Leaf64]
MRVFLTGATGFIGSKVLNELIAAGHQVIGVVRSESGADAVLAAGGEPYQGTLEAPNGLAEGAAQADAVVHTAFDHDFTKFVANCEKDTRVIEAIGGVLAGSNRPFLITSGVGMGNGPNGEAATEQVFDRQNANPRRMSELEGEAIGAKGVSVSFVRLPQVHDTQKQGLISPMIEIARQRGFAAYVGEGAGRWSAVHVSDAARLYRLALEQHENGARYHAVAESGLPARLIAEAIGEGLSIPVRSLAPDEIEAYYGHFAHFATMDLPATSYWTRQTLGWAPTGPGLIEDLQNMDFGKAR